VRIGQRARAGGDLAARRVGGHRQPVLLSAPEAITSRLAAKADWTVRALSADLKTAGINVSHDTVWRFLRRQGLTFKKNSTGQRDRSAQPRAPADAVANLPKQD